MMSRKLNGKGLVVRRTALAMVVASAAALAGMGFGISAATAAPQTAIVLKNKPPKCAPGFKAIKIERKGYLCVSQQPVCSYGQVFNQRFNKAANRFEYVCVLPEG